MKTLYKLLATNPNQDIYFYDVAAASKFYKTDRFSISQRLIKISHGYGQVKNKCLKI